MNSYDERNRFSHFAKIYADAWDAYLARDVNLTRDPDDKENPVRGDWRDQHYMSVGVSSMRIVTQSLLVSGREMPKRILDFPCGSGRVTRHMRAMFPEAKIGACDLYQGHVDFCAEQFSAEPILSRENFDELNVGHWDLIFCGSLLTHLPANLFWSAISFIIRSLGPAGIAVVTLEGRHAIHIQENKWKFIADDLFDLARKDYFESGFGFVDYEHEFRSSSFSKQETYGVALTGVSWLMRGLERIPNIRILGFSEREWDDHQDVVVFGRPGVNE